MNWAFSKVAPARNLWNASRFQFGFAVLIFSYLFLSRVLKFLPVVISAVFHGTQVWALSRPSAMWALGRSSSGQVLPCLTTENFSPWSWNEKCVFWSYFTGSFPHCWQVEESGLVVGRSRTFKTVAFRNPRTSITEPLYLSTLMKYDELAECFCWSSTNR